MLQEIFKENVNISKFQTLMEENEYGSGGSLRKKINVKSQEKDRMVSRRVN